LIREDKDTQLIKDFKRRYISSEEDAERGMIIMSLLLAGSAIWMIRRRQTE